MAPTTTVALLVMCVSLTTGGGGALLIKKARAMPAPQEPTFRTISGTVVAVITTTCGSRNSPRRCFRPVVDYIDRGTRMQVVSRTAYSPDTPHRKGERVDVLVEANGAAWIEREWKERRARRQSEYETARDFPLWMGWLLVGCGAFGLLLAAGLVFFVDRSGEATV